MDQQATTFYELRLRTHFLESKAAAFQDLFVAIMSKAYPEDFFPCRPWGRAGDRKNDGYLKSERTLFQVYAPNEMRMADAVNKIRTDFREALPHWKNYFDTWVFVHNSHGGLPPDVIAELLQLESVHPPLKLTHWGFDELLRRFQRLSPEAMSSLYGFPPSSAEAKKPSEVRRKLKLAQELVRDRKSSEGVKEMKEALVIARADGNDEEEVEILVALALSVDPGTRRRSGDRQYYFQEAEKKVDKLKSNAAKAIYFRARAAALDEARDLAGAEEAYRAALECCCTETDDEQASLAAQGCVVRSSLVHFLCNEKRLDEARPLLAECEAYAREHKEAEEGELLQAALEAGIHFSLEAGTEDGAIQRIAELEMSASTSRLADRIGGDLINVANRASHRDAHRTALAAAEASVRLGRRCEDRSPSFLVGALYTEAMVILKAGNDNDALQKAEAILDLCHGPEDAIIKQATQHLIAEIRRCSGDSQAAVDLARTALSTATGGPEEIAFTKLALARALNDNGQTEEALKQAGEGWVLLRRIDIPAEAKVEVLSHIANYASQLGAHKVAADAIAELEALPRTTDELESDKARAVARAGANKQLRTRLLEFIRKRDSPPSRTPTKRGSSLAETNARAILPLIGWWDEVLDSGPEFAATAYEFWGRGNFSRILRNAQRFPNAFNVTVEVRCLDDIKRAIRLWGLYADLLILLWKGPTESAWKRALVPGDMGGPGGWGYIIFPGTTLRKQSSDRLWLSALGYGSSLPEDIVNFIATEAKPFIRSGRLIVVPAVGAGCINPGHGPFEQLFAEALNAIPSVRWNGYLGHPIGHVPYSPDAPFDLLAEMAESEGERLRKLRLLLLKRSQLLSPNGDLSFAAKTLELEIDDALRDLDDRNSTTARKKGLARATEPLVGTTAPFRSSGQRLGGIQSQSPFAPLFALQSLGYGWRVDGTDVPSFPTRFEPKGKEMVGAWLAPPKAGWRFVVGNGKGASS